MKLAILSTIFPLVQFWFLRSQHLSESVKNLEHKRPLRSPIAAFQFWLSKTSLNKIQGTPVREGSRFLVSTPISWSRLEPSSESTQALTRSGEVVVISNISRHTSAESGGESDPIMQLIRGTYSAGSAT